MADWNLVQSVKMFNEIMDNFVDGKTPSWAEKQLLDKMGPINREKILLEVLDECEYMIASQQIEIQKLRSICLFENHAS